MMTSYTENELLETFKDDLPDASAFHQEVNLMSLLSVPH